MTDKEKAQAYDEALERARKILDKILNNELPGFPDQIRGIFPELKESEDERIIQAIYEAIKDAHINTLKEYGSSCKEALDWLKEQFEKQKEQKPAVEQLDGTFNSYDMAKTFVEGQYYVMEHPERFGLCKPAEWSENESNLLDSIIEDYEKANRSFCEYDGKIGLLKAIRSGEYNLPKQEWSEEDDNAINAAATIVEGKGLKDIANRLKSIRNRPKASNTWRPSKEQMDALAWYSGNSGVPPTGDKAIKSLYEDLKKLM